ncbi:MAG: type IV pilus modification PilV family protein [Kiritimatiellia bacterium]|jgi:prepilin-type N-terminal cleavage/methylation domain-containing protein
MTTASRSGMTLVEVLMAVVILGVCMLGLMQGISASLEVFNASAYIHQAANVLARGDAEHPMIVESDPVEDLVVSPDSSIEEGWTYERIVEEDEDEDGIYVVRTKVVKGRGGLGMEEEYVRLFYHGQGGRQ